ncbi:MAG TPA: NAD(P)/FAD-dependent oxidoreductase [Terriglobia bacterium]|jgi:2-polyprenyl-6-methoxyphenol hydroxylase-like FAD-dependent oxidoreductase
MHVAHDIVISGGGIAGTTAAAALAQLNYRVLVVEPGLDHARRLAGELIHPPGVAALRELGLLTPLQEAGAIPVSGFAVFVGDADILRYDEVAGLGESGLAIEHGTMARALLAAVEKLPTVTVWRGARITGLDLAGPDSANVTVNRDGRDCQLRTPLVVAADGRNSHVRQFAGIPCKQIHISNMTGFLIEKACLPHPGFGHVFANGPTPALAYAISLDQTRIMFDGPATPDGTTACLKALPEPLRSSVGSAMETQAPLVAANYWIAPAAVVKGPLVCVGDAGGCCHPVTATGLSACARDAVRLKQSIQETGGDIPRALRRYTALREGPQRARMAGAQVLYEVLKGGTPEMFLLRRGLLRYWKQSLRGRAATMALLSTHDERPFAVVREYMQVCRYALPEVGRVPKSSSAMLGLPGAIFKVLKRVS